MHFRPKPQLLWYKDSALLLTSDYLDNRIRILSKDYVLLVEQLRKADEGSYRCQGNNSIGFNHFAIKLIVHGKKVPT